MPGLTRLATATSAAAALLGLCLTGCGSTNPTSGAADSAGGTGSGSEQPATISIVEKDGSITPDDGHVIDVDKGQDVQLVVTTDAADEIHVHSIPEHEFEVEAGADSEKLPEFSIDTPGRFIIESHGLNVTLVTLQVG